MIDLALGLVEVIVGFVLIIALAAFIGKTAGKFFDNEPR